MMRSAWTVATHFFHPLSNATGVHCPHDGVSFAIEKTMPDSELPYPKWQTPCVDAVMEFDTSKLLERINIAETAIAERLKELDASPDGAHERRAIDDAIKTLRNIKKDRLKPA